MRSQFKKAIWVIAAGLSMIFCACSNNATTDSNIKPTLTVEQAAGVEHLSEGEIVTISPSTQEDSSGTQGQETVATPTVTEIAGTPTPSVKPAFLDVIKLLPATTIVSIDGATDSDIAACFYQEEISDDVFARISGKSYSEDCTVELSELRYLRVLHYGFDNNIYIGELIVNYKIAQDVLDILMELYQAKYPIERMVLVDEYDADDLLSMKDNNTSAFNFRFIDGTTDISNHSYGWAIDINPKYNPYVRTINGEVVVIPESGAKYADRTLTCDYYINKDDICYQAFIKRGFTWGGDWKSEIDYQHFQKIVE